MSDGGRLHIVSTPIGNLEDITLRALRILKEVDVVLAEDTRQTRKLLNHYDIRTRLESFHGHSSGERAERLVARLRGGTSMALVSDAGMPLISDPGAPLVSQAIDSGVSVECVGGISAVTTALATAGLPCDQFRFVGFLPRKGRKRADAFERMATDAATTVFFESPHRIGSTLRDLESRLGGDRMIAVCRELTKRHEEVLRGTAAELSQAVADRVRGEVTVVVAGLSRREARRRQRRRLELGDGSDA